MPKVSKVKVRQPKASSRATEAPRERPQMEKFQCSVCGKIYTRQKQNFPISHSALYRGNNGYFTTCNNCFEGLFEHYKEALGGEIEAIKRMCLKYDIYWNPVLYGMIYKGNTNGSRMRQYMSKTNLAKWTNKTYDDTLDEDPEKQLENSTMYVLKEIDDEEMRVAEEEEENSIFAEVKIAQPTQADVDFWGMGFAPEFYFELNKRFEKWTADVQLPLDKSTEALYKQICILEVTINRNIVAGKPIEQSVNALNSLMGSANLKPVQKKAEEQDSAFEELPFGVGIRMCENTRPIPKPNPELEDVDGIVRYVSIWFLGHLCKMLGIRNTYCKLYEEEMARLKVERLDNEEEDDEGAFNEIFGDSGGDI